MLGVCLWTHTRIRQSPGSQGEMSAIKSPENTMQTPTIGIDFGTTNSVITLAEGGEYTVIPNENGKRTTPSVVSFDGDKAMIGEQAVNQAVQYPDRTVFSIKRLIGTDDVVLLGEHSAEFTPEEVSALIFKKLKRDAEKATDQPIGQAVITVPAQFNDRQRRAMKHAGEIAGLDVHRIISEPTAACLAYGLHTGKKETVLVYDLGGGMFDVSLIAINDGVFEVVATNGDTQLGGNNWDAAIVDWLDSKIEHKHGISFEGNSAADEQLFAAAQTAKHNLTDQMTTAISIQSLEHNGSVYDIKHRLHRDQFERMTRDLVEKTITICDDLFAETGYRAGMIDEILLVGGATRMPHVRERVTEYFGQEPSEQIDPDEAVAVGATAQAALIQDDSLPMLPSGEDQSANPRPERDRPSLPTIEDVVLLDVTPQSLATETTAQDETEEPYSVLIPANSTVPTRATGIFTTSHDRQKYVRIPVYQGNSPVLEENELLEEFRVGPIPPRSVGEANIEIEFELDQNGILHVSAADIDHEIGDAIDIDPVFDITQTELDMMKKDLPPIR
jgi:molecular chaperone DnaK